MRSLESHTAPFSVLPIFLPSAVVKRRVVRAYARLRSLRRIRSAPAEDIAPLIVAAHFKLTAVFAVQAEEVIALHKHVAEFEEGQPAFETLFVTFRAKHFVHGKMHGDIAHEIHEVEVSEPVRIVHDNSTVFSVEANQPLHLFFDAGNIVVKLFNAEQFAQLRLSGRIGNHCRASAEKHDGMMPAFLHMRHNAHCNIVTDGETFRRGIKADVKRQLFFAEKFAKLLRV